MIATNPVKVSVTSDFPYGSCLLLNIPLLQPNEIAWLGLGMKVLRLAPRQLACNSEGPKNLAGVQSQPIRL